jgi:hypothetical protein
VPSRTHGTTQKLCDAAPLAPGSSAGTHSCPDGHGASGLHGAVVVKTHARHTPSAQSALAHACVDGELMPPHL